MAVAQLAEQSLLIPKSLVRIESLEFFMRKCLLLTVEDIIRQTHLRK